MNQILAIENNKKKNKAKKVRTSSGPIEIKNIIRFFAIVIIVFGICIISHSSYALYRDAKGSNTENLASISISRENDTLIVDVQSQYVVDYFKYNWQNTEQTSVSEGKTSFEEEIVLPNESDILTIVLEDETGRAVTYVREINLDGIDIIKPSIDIQQGQGLSVRVKASDETKIEYMTYRIDDGEEIRIDKNNEEDKTIEYAVTDIPRGEHTIYVTAVDSFGNTEKAQQPIIVSSERPTINSIDIDEENGKIIIQASDVDGLQSIEVNLNGQEYFMDNLNRTEASFSLNLIQGTNTLSIKLTNVNGITAEGATEFDYAG